MAARKNEEVVSATAKGAPAAHVVGAGWRDGRRRGEKVAISRSWVKNARMITRFWSRGGGR